MAARSKKGLKGSIDDVLGGLLEDDDAVPRKSTMKSPILGEPAGRPRGIISTDSKRSLVDDDFFRNLAKEAGRADGEESDVSDEDPAALLQTMKDIDDMDADLFGLKKPRSAPSRTSITDSGLDGARGDPSKSGKPSVFGKEFAPVSEKKPLSAPADSSRQSAPADSSRQYRKFSFDELDDPLAGLLSDDEDAAEKKRPVLQSKAAPENIHRAATKETSATSPTKPIPGMRRKEELTFEDDSNDLMDALGFGDSPVIQRKEKSRDSDARPARSKMDDLLGLGTSAKLLERPATGERKEFKLDPKYQKTPDKDDLFAEDDFLFGSYQPTMSSTPEGRQSRRQSVRFSSENISEVKADQKSKPTTPATASPARGSRNGGDWLGLKDEIPDSPLKDTAADAKAILTSPARPDQTQAEDENWLANALSRKKALQQEKVPVHTKGSDTVDHRTQMERSNVHPEAGKLATAPVTHRETTIVPAGGEAKSNRVQKTKSSVSQGTTPEATTVPTGPKSEPLHAASSQRDTAILRQTENSQAHHMRADLVSNSLYEKQFLANQQTGHLSEITITHTQVMDLMSKIQKLELEREQQKMLLESLQMRHQEDLALIENAHRNRLKVLEQTFQQREERLQQENQGLSAQYMSRCQSAEQEKSQLLAQYQRKLDEFEKEKAKEMERLRELQRISIQDMRKDHEEQLQRLKRLKDQEIDAVTSASSHTRSLNGVIEQMEGFSSKLNDLSYKVESTHQNTSHELEIGARQRDEQLRVLQERLTRQQRDMEEERGRLHEVITKMETRLNEQTRLLEQERWRVNAEQSKVESLQRSLEEQRRIMTQQLSMEREELERAKSALLEEQHSVMHRCTEERRKLATEWSDFHSQQKLVHERAERDVNRVLQIDTQREGSIISIAKEQAQLKIQASELRLKQEQLTATMETLAQDQEELKQEKERINSAALRVRQRAEEIDSMSKLASQKYQEGEKALQEAHRVEAEHQGRLHTIHQQMERLRLQEQHLHQERINIAQQSRQLDRLRLSLPSNPSLMPMTGTPGVNLPNIHEFFHSIVGPVPVSHSAPDVTALRPSEFHAKMALLKYSAARDRDFLEDEQHFLASLKTSDDFSTSQKV